VNGRIKVARRRTTCGSAGSGSTDDDVILYSPRMIIDALRDDTVPGTVSSGDVIGRNITMTAGDNGIGQISGIGGIGLPDNFLEIAVNGIGGALGVLKAFDTAADDDKTAGIYLDQVAGDMTVDTVITEGNTCASGLNDLCTGTGNVSLRSSAGSIVDARSGGTGIEGGAANVFGQTIDIDANGGSIGNPAGTNDLEIDSSRGSFFPGFTVPGLAAAADDVSLEARDSIFVTETDGYLRLVLAHATRGNIRLTVRESTPDVDGPVPDRGRLASFAEDNSTLPGKTSARPVDPQRDGLRRGCRRQRRRACQLQAGDDVFTHQNQPDLRQQQHRHLRRLDEPRHRQQRDRVGHDDGPARSDRRRLPRHRRRRRREPSGRVRRRSPRRPPTGEHLGRHRRRHLQLGDGPASTTARRRTASAAARPPRATATSSSARRRSSTAART
jgi:hypothetical protein